MRSDKRGKPFGLPRFVLIGTVTDFFDFTLQIFQIHKGLRPAARVAQKGGRVVERHHVNARLFSPLSMLLGNFKVLPDQLHCGDTAQTDNDPGPDKSNLIAQVADTCFLLNVQRVPVCGGGT